jgi:hypothetical protein
LVQGVVQRGLFLIVERVNGAYQNFKRIVRKRLLTLFCQSQTNASSIGVRAPSD